ALPPEPEVVVADVLENVLDRPRAETGIQGRDRAERAGKRTAASRLDDAGDEEALRQQVVARRGKAAHRRGLTLVTWPQRAGLGIGDEPRPGRLGFSDDDAVAVAQHFARGERCVWSASDDDF